MDGRAEETRGDTGKTGAGGSPVCSAIGDKSPRGLSSADSSLSDPGGGRWKSRGLARHRSMVRVASQPRRRSKRGLAGTRYAQAPGIISEEIEEVGTQLGADSGGGPCP